MWVRTRSTIRGSLRDSRNAAAVSLFVFLSFSFSSLEEGARASSSGCDGC